MSQPYGNLTPLAASQYLFDNFCLDGRKKPVKVGDIVAFTSGGVKYESSSTDFGEIVKIEFYSGAAGKYPNQPFAKLFFKDRRLTRWSTLVLKLEQ